MTLVAWAPAAMLCVGCMLSLGVRPQLTMPLARPLSETVPKVIDSDVGTDRTINKDEAAVAGMTSYVMRTYAPAGAAASAFRYSIYVGYYDSQMRGRTIHSPKNCLPGGGWEALSSGTATIATAAGAVEVNKYLLHREGQQALVVYWYQGRGRIEASEYRVKWNLLRDAAVHRRSEEAIVRVMVPVYGSEEDAFKLAASVAARLMPAVEQALPTQDGI